MIDTDSFIAGLWRPLHATWCVLRIDGETCTCSPNTDDDIVSLFWKLIDILEEQMPRFHDQHTPPSDWRECRSESCQAVQEVLGRV